MKLEDLRQSKRLSKREVARRMAMTHQNVTRLEISGSAPIETLEAYASALGEDFITIYQASKETRKIAV